ncbi:hypothetical protein MMAD_28470 [Mycolicibacterium madagascariense]|uniref:DUF4383 domain-containing protein n=1 Tax=Mycolicibacterium madagascariense TaxID=212765 RepID=A0A7I7XH57_9MYCO|nr:hypothetical protein [Mycolicibacterium madagascariense]MCV7014357.1 hypothetical protein [Mycolicibacterium madagascariense]BBZ28552.1 hypothetical protein MMAD_28470 [Mycolicibacterium madagascariense]
MAKDTRGPVPYGESDLRRVNLNPSHWRGARLVLGAQAAAALVIGAAGLICLHDTAFHGIGVAALGLELTTAFCWTMVVVGICAAAATLHRGLAKAFSVAVGIAALIMVVTSAVAATHHDPGPMGFTPGAAVLYAAFFCVNLGIGMWLIPNHIEGPAWVHTGRTQDGEADASAQGGQS